MLVERRQAHICTQPPFISVGLKQQLAKVAVEDSGELPVDQYFAMRLATTMVNRKGHRVLDDYALDFSHIGSLTSLLDFDSNP